MAYVLQTYEENLRERLEEIKALAAVRVTYGDNWKLEETLRDELAFIRKHIRNSQRSIAKYRARDARERRSAERHGFEHDSYWIGYVDDHQETLDIERAHRDELSEGLRELKRQERQNSRDLARFVKIYTQEKAERAIEAAERDLGPLSEGERVDLILDNDDTLEGVDAARAIVREIAR